MSQAEHTFKFQATVGSGGQESMEYKSPSRVVVRRGLDGRLLSVILCWTEEEILDEAGCVHEVFQVLW